MLRVGEVPGKYFRIAKSPKLVGDDPFVTYEYEELPIKQVGTISWVSKQAIEDIGESLLDVQMELLGKELLRFAEAEGAQYFIGDPRFETKDETWSTYRDRGLLWRVLEKLRLAKPEYDVHEYVAILATGRIA